MTATVDAKGRLTIPADLRRMLGIQEGDTLLVDAADGVLRIAKAESPFDALAEEALAEHRAGGTRPLREYAGARGLRVDA